MNVPFLSRVNPMALLTGSLVIAVGWTDVQAAGPAEAVAVAEAPPSGLGPLELRLESSQAIERVAAAGDDLQRWIDRELGQERVIKGAPYCADAVHESVQPLADGNRIVNRHSTRLCRDSEGRTRQEVVGRDGRRTVYLRDPVARASWVLDPQRKTARRSVRTVVTQGVQQIGVEASAWREHADRLREWAQQMADRARDRARGSAPADRSAAPAAPGASAPWPVIVTHNETQGADGTQREVEVQVVRVPRDSLASAPMPPVPPMPPSLHADAWTPPPAVGAGASRLAPRGPGVVTALPAREIAGVKVHGERTTWTIEAGKLGNEKPIVIVREVWTSPELMLTVQSRDADPRSGEVNYRLEHVVRSEPDAALFRVPADYDTGRKAAPSAPAASARG